MREKWGIKYLDACHNLLTTSISKDGPFLSFEYSLLLIVHPKVGNRKTPITHLFLRQIVDQRPVNFPLRNRRLCVVVFWCRGNEKSFKLTPIGGPTFTHRQRSNRPLGCGTTALGYVDGVRVVGYSRSHGGGATPRLRLAMS